MTNSSDDELDDEQPPPPPPAIAFLNFLTCGACGESFIYERQGGFITCPSTRCSTYGRRFYVPNVTLEEIVDGD